MRNILLLLLSFILFSYQGFSQAEGNEPIQMTGIVLDAENLEPIPFASVLMDKGKRGTVADNQGYFSFLAYPGDTLVFRSVGYQSREFVIPEILEGNSYSMIELMIRENLILDEVVVYPLPEVEDFAETMLKQELTDRQKIKLDRFKVELNQILESEYQKEAPYYEQWRYAKIYDMTGIVPPNNFLNPITWSNFVRDWKKRQQDR